MSFDVAVIGSLNSDMSVRVRAFPQPGETLLGDGLVVGTGGKGANQAIAAARSGARTIMIGAVGDDDRGRSLVAALERDDVDTSRIAHLSDLASGLAIILVNAGGENMIVVEPGANAAMRLTDPSALPAAYALLAQLEIPLDTVAAAFREARGRGRRCILNAAPFDESARTLFALADIIIVNEIELAQYTGQEPVTEPARLVEQARTLLVRDDQSIVVTCGADGVVTIDRHGARHTPALPVTPVDTTGAGDCFCGSLAAKLAAGATLDQAVLRANAAAALCVQQRGAAEAMPTGEQIDRLLRDSGLIL